MISAYRTFLFLLLLPLLSALSAQESFPKPTGFLVNDNAGILSRQEVVTLGEKLRAYREQTSTEIVVITDPSLNGADPFEYANGLARAWGIGGAENDNGVLIYIAIEDRKIAIQTGYGAEGFLPDVLANRIINEIMQPAFRQQQYYEGIDRATSAIMDLGRGDYEGMQPQNQRRDAQGGRSAIYMILFLVAMFFLVSYFNRRNDDDDDDGGGYHRGGRYDQRRSRGGWIFFPGGFGGGGGGGGGFGGGGGGGFGGGGFGGFGGGGFGGGGAIGGW